MTTREWTDLDNVSRVAIDFMNGEHTEFNIEVVVSDSNSQPLWLTYRDSDGLEVIVPWVSMRQLKVLERREEEAKTDEGP